MLSLIKKECLSYKTQCDELIPRCEESQPTLLHCRIRAEKICASLDELDEDPSSVSVEEQIDILKAFVFVILDYTFFVENDLAEKNFATAEAKSAVYRLLDDLDKPRLIYDTQISGESSPSTDDGDDPPSIRTFDEAVGNDLAECLYWRKGALIYMYHSATEGRLPSESNKAEMARLLRCGVDNLKKMLSVRQEFKVIDNDAFVHDDGNTLQLIQRGLFSDTHVLALMYAGEMCFWFVKWVGEERTDDGEIQDPSTTSSSSTSSSSSSSTSSSSSLAVESPFPRLSFSSVGVELLTRYKEAVAGPLKSAGWSSEKAQEILDFFQSS